MKKLLLISNSTHYGSGYLDHCEEEIKKFLGKEIRKILFVPYASGNLDSYAEQAKKRFHLMGYESQSVHESPDPVKAINIAESIFVAGGNTFRLLSKLYELDILENIKRRVETGMPYMGVSAGSNIACPTIKTTNDMPVIYPPSFDALNLVPFNINPHYIDPDPNSTHRGETREERIREFHELNSPVVVGLREGSILQIEGNEIQLKGKNSVRIFKKGEIPVEYPSGSFLNFLFNSF